MLQTNGAVGIAAAARREIRDLDDDIPTRSQPVGERIEGSLVRERVLARLASATGLTALVLGIRVALGATSRAVVWSVLRDCLVVAAFLPARRAASVDPVRALRAE